MASVEQLALNHQSAIEARLTAFNAALVELASKWKPMIASLVGNLQTPQQRAALEQIQHLSEQLRQQLKELGYDDLIEDFITGYDDSVAYAVDVERVLIGQQAPPSRMLKDALKQVQQLDLAALKEVGDNTVAAITRQLTLDVTVGVKRKDMLEAVEETLDGELAGQAAKYADTAVRQYDRTATMGVWKEAGIKKFRYSGPKDNKNRDFCSQHLGKVYTLDEIGMLDNGQALPVLIYGGGWRCRHHFAPVPETK